MTPDSDQFTDEPESSDEDIDSIFAVATYEQHLPAPRPFQPWHRPRKQLVREEVWGSELRWLIEQKQTEDDGLKYLGLPGSDLLDLRYIYEEFCETDDRRLKFLGFDDAALPDSPHRDALNVSLQEVRSLRNVDKGSEVLGENFRLLADKRSIAWDTAERIGPFDVINVDLCGQLTGEEPTMDISIYNAIYNVCALQNRRARPWSLLLTSRVNRENVAPNALERLIEALTNNLGNCTAFFNNFSDAMGFSDVDTSSVAALADRDFFGTIMIGLTKWLLGLAFNINNRFSVSKIVGYRVYGGAPYMDMVSIAYRFEPIVGMPPDPIGLATAVPEQLSECEQASAIPAAIIRVVDVDAELQNAPLLYDVFRDKSAELLRQARYDSEAYKVWADKYRSLCFGT